MNVYAIDSNGKVQTEIKNISCFHPLSKSVIVAKTVSIILQTKTETL